MPETPQDVAANPAFRGLPPDQQREVLGRRFPAFKGLPPAEQLKWLSKNVQSSRDAESLSGVNGPTPSDHKVGKEPSLLSPAGMKSAFYNAAHGTVNALPAIGATIGGIAGGVAGAPTGPGAVLSGTEGAMLGGAGGEAAKQLAERALGEKAPATSSEAANKIGREALMQGAMELVGQGVGRVAGAGARALKPATEISGVPIRESVGQVAGKPGGLLQTTEHYLSKTWLGGPLKKVQAAQEEATRNVLSKLSKATDAKPENLVKNWEMASKETQIAAEPLYQSIAGVETPEAGKVAQEILDNNELRLSSGAKKALAKAAGSSDNSPAMATANQTAKNLGFKNWAELKAKDPSSFERYLPQDLRDSLSGARSTVDDVLKARTELREAATHAEPRDARLLWNEWERLNSAIDQSLTPEQQAVKKQADLLWKRSYIMEDIGKKMNRMTATQDPVKPKMVPINPFVSMVNSLAHEPLGKEGTQVVGFPSKLEALFDNPEDRKAMVELASFLSSKYSEFGGRTGITEGIARVGVALEAYHAAAEAAENIGTSSKIALNLAGMFGLSAVLAHPGGPRAVLTFFQHGGTYGIPALLRIGELATEKKGAKETPSRQQLLQQGNALVSQP